ncbi:MAG: sensor histidine kinase [Desulfobacterota bacterium]|nr:sensor histidine kinase [Thermodesulfobacteriota bacterium]
MNGNWELLGQPGLQFFGKMSASISHEIKNVMAIINENAGLLEDFTVMAEKGMPIDPQRLKTRASMIMKQIRRGDEIIQGMNRFAHSVDEPQRQADLNDTLSLMVALSNRFAFMRGVTLELEPAAEPVPVVTNPFFLENLLWLCLDFAMGSTGAGKTVVLRAERSDTGPKIRFSRLQDLAHRDTCSFPGQHETALLQTLKAGLVLHKESGEIHLTFPVEAER